MALGAGRYSAPARDWHAHLHGRLVYEPPMVVLLAGVLIRISHTLGSQGLHGWMRVGRPNEIKSNQIRGMRATKSERLRRCMVVGAGVEKILSDEMTKRELLHLVFAM